jgi:hypothetical protein
MKDISYTLKDLFDVPALKGLAGQLEIGIEPTRITLNGVSEVVMTYEFEGRGTTVSYEAAWSFVWGRLYCVKTISSDFAFGFPEPVLINEHELLRDIQDLHACDDFALASEVLELDEDDLEFLIVKLTDYPS